MKFVVEVVFPGVFRNFALVTRVREFPHAVDAVQYIREWQKNDAKYPKKFHIVSYKITLVKE